MAKRSLSETEEQRYYDDDDDDEEEEEEEQKYYDDDDDEEEEEDGEESDDEEVENGENDEEGREGRVRLAVKFSGDQSKGVLSSQSRVCCQVSDCGQDLEEAKAYYLKHKVCEYHAKAVVVSINGIDMRYCQQCSRFQEISEFDDTKRSCRKKLAGHNERRRKVCADLPVEEEAVHIPSVSDVKDKSWRVRSHLEHLTTRVQRTPSFKQFL